MVLGGIPQLPPNISHVAENTLLVSCLPAVVLSGSMSAVHPGSPAVGPTWLMQPAEPVLNMKLVGNRIADDISVASS